MSLEKEKLAKASEILRKMASGINPLNGEPIGEGSFLHDPRMIRCLYFIQEVVDRAEHGHAGTRTNKLDAFVITAEEKQRVELPQGRIGVNEFANCVNRVIDLNRSKKMTGMELNKRLKKIGVLEEEVLADGKTRTMAGARSHEYGIETEKRSRHGNDYEMILFNDRGKTYLLDNLETIMGCCE